MTERGCRGGTSVGVVEEEGGVLKLPCSRRSSSFGVHLGALMMSPFTGLFAPDCFSKFGAICVK